MKNVFPIRTIYQIKISLSGLKPAIFRTILVEDDRTFYEFHHIIQIAMGWENYHLFQFISGDSVIADPYLLDDDRVLNSKEIKLKQLFNEVGKKLKYEYDFGDGWIHNIRLMKILNINLDEQYPSCIRGKRNSPPEDCGGTWGYENLIEIMADKKHSEYKDMKNWLGGSFDPEKFDINEINEELKNLEEYIDEDYMFNDNE